MAIVNTNIKGGDATPAPSDPPPPPPPPARPTRHPAPPSAAPCPDAFGAMIGAAEPDTEETDIPTRADFMTWLGDSAGWRGRV